MDTKIKTAIHIFISVIDTGLLTMYLIVYIKRITVTTKLMGKVGKLHVKWLKGTDDLADAYKIRFRVFVEEQNVPPDIEIDEIDGTAHHIVVYQDGIPVGTGRVFEQNGRYYLGRIAVLKEYRKQHIGSLIVDLLLQKAFELGAAEVHIHAQTSALGFYKKLGFIPYGEPFDEAGIEHVNMVAGNLYKKFGQLKEKTSLP